MVISFRPCVLRAQVHDLQVYEYGEPEEGPGLEEEFEMEKGRRSLASLLESDDDDVIVADATAQDDSLLVRLPSHAAGEARRGGVEDLVGTVQMLAGDSPVSWRQPCLESFPLLRRSCIW